MRAVHLCVMELKRDLKLVLQVLFAISAPADERVVEDTRIHADNAVKLSINDCRCTYYHIVS